MNNFLREAGKEIARLCLAITPETHGVLEPFFRGKNLLKKVWPSGTLRNNISVFAKRHSLETQQLPTFEGNIFDKDAVILSAYFKSLGG